jgi:hypothetical protein
MGHKRLRPFFETPRKGAALRMTVECVLRGTPSAARSRDPLALLTLRSLRIFADPAC